MMSTREDLPLVSLTSQYSSCYYRWATNFLERGRAELRRIPIPRTPVNKLSMAVRDSTVCHHYSVDKPRARREESMTSTNIIRWGGIAAMLGCLYSSSHCNLLSFASTSATIERRQLCPRMSRRPVTTSQTSHAASP